MRRACVLTVSLVGCFPASEETVKDGVPPVGDGENVIGLLVVPEDVVLPTGRTTQLRATGLLASHDSLDLTATVDWVADDSSVATVSDALDEEGLLRAQSPGTTSVYATYGALRSPTARVQVTDAELERLAIAPARVDLAAGEAVSLSATARFSDGTTGDFSQQVRWVTDDAAVARFGEPARLEAVAAGETSISAVYEDASSDPVPVVVVAAASANLRVETANGDISGGVLDLGVTVRNEGTTGASDFWVDVFVDPSSDPEVGDIGDDFFLVPYAGAESTASLEFQVPVEAGDHRVVVFVDTNDDIVESDEQDNQLDATLGGGSTVGGADLAIDYFDYYSDGASVYWFVDVINQGDADADWFFVDLFIDQTDAPVMFDDGDEYSSIDGIAAGDTDFADFIVERACSGCQSWVMVDGYDTVEETNEDNNVAGALSVWAR